MWTIRLLPRRSSLPLLLLLLLLLVLALLLWAQLSLLTSISAIQDAPVLANVLFSVWVRPVIAVEERSRQSLGMRLVQHALALLLYTT